MLVVMHKEASEENIQQVLSYFRSLSIKAERLPGAQRVAIGVTGNKEYAQNDEVERMAGVLEVIHVTHAYKKVSREFIAEDTQVKVGDACFGGDIPVVIAGPCSVENHDQVMETARLVKSLGGKVLRGGIFKPR